MRDERKREITGETPGVNQPDTEEVGKVKPTEGKKGKSPEAKWMKRNRLN